MVRETQVFAIVDFFQKLCTDQHVQEKYWALYTLQKNQEISQKNKKGDTSKGVGNTLQPAQKFTKNKNMYGIDSTYASF